ncbi:HNH endonuclease signature motif containing protein [Gordonia paraffinivorans]|uniref:HNH endonuclease signature motif containing protein n=1 Tax=Gordonia paraffinivorans TaxID=175628 RepID=UPI00144773D5|nr:HNH endonuclease signature motif containing protein [Gordonia paraffinivorans]
MALSDITRNDVLKAIRTYDELGAEEFLSRYGFAPARQYRIAENGRLYDSKAIVGVAHGYATGKFLRSGDFSGGRETVVKALEPLGFSFAPEAGESTRSWLVTSKDDYRRLGGFTKYDDDPTSHYSYDSNVANSRQVAVGDRLVFWDEETLIGASVVASIHQEPGTKTISRCPVCSTTNIAARKTKSPRFRCDSCHAEFDEPVLDEVEVTLYRTDHRQGWVDLAGLLDGAELRKLVGYSQNSIRRIEWSRFVEAIEAVAGPRVLTPVDTTATQIVAGGHAIRQVRVRVGQPAFRAELLRKFGPVCAFTGNTPPEALEACHLYSFAEVGRHEAGGGLLLRGDLHRLFDQGLLAVNVDQTIDVADSIKGYPLYAALHGQELKVKTSPRERGWLAKHWSEWRSAV